MEIVGRGIHFFCFNFHIKVGMPDVSVIFIEPQFELEIPRIWRRDDERESEVFNLAESCLRVHDKVLDGFVEL